MQRLGGQGGMERKPMAFSQPPRQPPFGQPHPLAALVELPGRQPHPNLPLQSWRQLHIHLRKDGTRVDAQKTHHRSFIPCRFLKPWMHPEDTTPNLD